jgi:protein TonB
MLEDSLFESQGAGRTRKPITVTVAAIAHVITIGALIAIPLLQPQALPLVPVNTMSLRVPTLDLTRSIGSFVSQPHSPRIAPPDSAVLTTPQAIPDKIPYIDEAPVPVLAFAPSFDGNGVGRALPSGGFIPGGPFAPAEPVQPVQPPPPPPPAPTKITVIRRSVMEAASLIHQVKPEYPDIARRARVQGVVVMEAVINKDGAIDSLRVVSGNPLLNQAAVDAVKQWRYRPTLLNGEPVDVVTTITVTFTFQ